MGARERRGLPARLEAVRGRFERWRRTRKVRSRIPEPLWAAAVRAAAQYGIHRTARALRLNYYELKKRVEGASAAKKRGEASAAKKRGEASAAKKRGEASALPAGKVPAGSRFLELPAPAWPGCGECTLELENGGGAKLRVHLKGFEAPDLAALSRSFWQGE